MVDAPPVRVEMALPLAEAEMVSIFLETFLYGIFFTLFSITLIVLYRRAKAGNMQYRKLLPVGIVMFLIASAHVFMGFVRIVEAFVVGAPGSATAYYSNISHPLHAAKTACYVTQTILGDCVMLWRCFVVYGRAWYIAVPGIAILIANACAGYAVTWLLTRATSANNVFEISGANWITVFFVLTMIANSACTVAIAYRIYSHRCRLSSGTRSLLPVFIVIVESGALYAASVLSLLVAYVAKSNAQYMTLDAVTPFVGIVFSLIVLQIHFHIGSTRPCSTTVGDSAPNPCGGATGRHMHGISSLHFQLQPVNVHSTSQSEVEFPVVVTKKPQDP